MTVAALIIPMAPLDDETIDTVVRNAITAGLVACNPHKGAFRLAFFPKDRVPRGWSRIGVVTREAAPCAA